MSNLQVTELLRDNFASFAIKTFNLVNPGQELRPTAAFLAITHKLAQVADGKIKRLIINVPPRSGKSLLASIAFPAFVLGRDPTRRVICASYSSELSGKLARDCRNVLSHPSYRAIFPEMIIGAKNTENEIETTKGGFRFATSVGGTLTGRGGNLIVIDDPIKPDEAASRLARGRVWEWFTGTVGSRLDNKAEDAIVLVMQRVHVDDLSGRLLEMGGWDLLSIPAIAEDEQSLIVGPERAIVREPGHILDPEREPRHVLDELKRELGSATFEAQYQQQPVPETGGCVQWGWFNTYDVAPPRGPADKVVISWDTAMKDREVNDYSVGIVALVTYHKHVYILDVIRVRLDFPSLRNRIIAETRKHRAFNLIEDHGSGTSLLQELRRGPIRCVRTRPIGDKVVRFQAVTSKIEAGQVHLPARAPWLETFKRELLSFPTSTHDDQVDALSQLLQYSSRYTGPLVGTYSSRGTSTAAMWSFRAG
jgi:predicted phage terminase large subunit-like protein